MQKRSGFDNTTAELIGTYGALGAQVINVKDYGAVGNGSTDDTTAIQNAVTACAARSGHVLYFPGGDYKLTTMIAAFRGLRIVGDFYQRPSETSASRIKWAGTGAAIQIGTDNGHAWDAADYDGPQSVHIENLGFLASGSLTALSNGQGVGYVAGSTAIKDWRGGDVRLRNVSFESFEYGFWGIQSDVNHFDNVYVSYCKTAIFLGPRSDQNTLSRIYSLFCDRVLDIDGASVCRIADCQFVGDGSASINPILIHCSLGAIAKGISFDNCWHEHYQGATVIEAFVQVGVTAETNQPRNIVFRSPAMFTGIQASSNYAQHFLRVDKGDQIEFLYPVESDVANLVELVKYTGSASLSIGVQSIGQRDFGMTNSGAYTGRILQRREVFGHIEQRGQGGTFQSWYQQGDTQPRFELNGTTGILLGPGGSTAADVALSRSAANVLSLSAANTFMTGKGATGSRPSASAVGAGAMWFDTTLNQPIWSNGTVWVDAYGMQVDGAVLTSQLLTSGEEVLPRTDVLSNSLNMTSQTLRLSYFTARKTETISQVRLIQGNQTAGATPTISRVGVWPVNTDGSLGNILASTTNDTAYFTTAGNNNNAITKSFTASFTKTSGVRYAVGLLVVTAATVPQVQGANASLTGSEAAIAPRIAAQVGSQADLPTSVAIGSIGNTAARPYFALIP